MSTSRINPTIKSRGRPPVDSEQINARLPRDMLNAIDAFSAGQADTPSRPESVRRLLREALEKLGLLEPPSA